MRLRHWLVLSLLLPGCAQVPGESPGEAALPPTLRYFDAALTPAQLAGFMADAAGQPPAPEAIKRLEAASAENAAARVQYAYLLARPGASAADLARAAKLLEGLDGAFWDAGTGELVRQLQRQVALARDLAKAQGQAEALQKKIDQLKTLELELQRRGQANPGAKP